MRTRERGGGEREWVRRKRDCKRTERGNERKREEETRERER